MSLTLTQSDRLLAIETPLGEDTLMLASLNAKEELSRIYQFELDLRSEKPSKVKFDDIVGQNVTVSLTIEGSDDRYFNGYVCNFEQTTAPGGQAHYQATIVPWLWFLTRNADCRIFQNMKVPDIIMQVFRDHGYSDFEDALTGSYREWEYCVQYGETSFNFVSRLMEQEGIYYFFEHSKGQHKLILCDSISEHQAYGDYEKIKFQPSDAGSGTESECIRSCSLEQVVQPGVCVLNDFDFKVPQKALKTQSNITRGHAVPDFEIYDYPGEYIEYGEGEGYAKVRIEELHSQFEVLHGESDARGVCTGSTFEMTHCYIEDLNREYLVTSTHYQIRSNLPGEKSQSGSPNCTVSFTAMDIKQQFRSARLTPKPIIQGPQTAIVVGTSGEEIYTDEYGRVKVQFHWDREGKADENSSCWIRVAQIWAGKKWGAMYIPRIGQEVIVEFLNGDPDHPIITGRVYNGDQMPPYGLPANATQSTIKSNSSKGGDGSNEIRFEDKAGSEEVFIHAQKDQNIVVENDETTTIGNDRTENVGNNETITIGNDRTEDVGNNETITIGNDRSETVGNNETITIGSNRTETVGANETITIGADRTETVGSNETVTVALTRTHSVGVNDMCNVGAAQEITVGGAQAITVGAAQAITVGAAQAITVAKDASTTIGKNNTINVGKNLTIDAGDQIMIKTGKASILMKKDGTITIKGKDIKIDGSGKIDIKAKKNVIIKGKKILEN